MNEATKPLTVGSLFSGIGGIDLGLQRAGMEIKWQCEKDLWCRKILTKHWPKVPKYEDVTTLDPQAVEYVDVLAGGFPCQPFSFAGKQKGANDARNMWPEYRRCVEAIRPTWVLGENVSGAKRYIATVCKPDLEALGYRVRVFGIPACAVGAKHLRKRLFIVAYTNRSMLERVQEGYFETVRQPIFAEAPKQNHTFSHESRLFRFGDYRGIREGDVLPNRTHRIRGLGNAVVPLVVEFIGRCINASHRA